MSYRLGIDTGGTYTDAVLVDASDNVICSAKARTTHNQLHLGIRRAAEQVIGNQSASVELVSISTTLATNALVEGAGRPACLLLIGYTDKHLPRARLADASLGNVVEFVAGGHDAAGHEQDDLDEQAIVTLASQCSEAVEAFAVSSMFGTRNPAHELRARELLRDVSDLPITCGHELSQSLDAPRRALTALLNARLIPLIEMLIIDTRQVLQDLSINAPLMVVKGDGSLMSAKLAEHIPVETILSGPAASVVGANFLSGNKHVVVADMGGTTTDIAVIREGLPELDPHGASVGGYRTMVQAIRVNSFGIGGDSMIRFDRERRNFEIGPRRVVPLSRLIELMPQAVSELEQQLGQDRIPTHAGQFVMANRGWDATIRLSRTQSELWQRICNQPLSMQALFADQTLLRPLQRLVERGLVIHAGFAPTDACLLLGLFDQSSTDAMRVAELGARLLMRYSEANLGPTFDSEHAFAKKIKHLTAERIALGIVESLYRNKNESNVFQLSAQLRAFLADLFLQQNNSQLLLSAQLQLDLVGLGAPAKSFFADVGGMLGVRPEVPDLAGVANAVGAVAGSVRQQRSITITPAGGQRVRAHLTDGPVEFENLELAVERVRQELDALIGKQMHRAGAAEFTTSWQRADNVVENNGEKVFFESIVSVTASGRPMIA